MKRKHLGRYPWPLGSQKQTFFNERKVTKKYFSHQIGRKLGAGRERVGINIKSFYKTAFFQLVGVTFI